MIMQIRALALPPLPVDLTRSPMYEALADAIMLPRSSAKDIEEATIKAVIASCARWEAYFSSLALAHTEGLKLVNDTLGEINASIAEEERKNARNALLLNIIISVAVIGFLGPAAGTFGASLRSAPAAVAETASVAEKAINASLRLAAEIDKEFIKNSIKEGLKVAAKQLMGATNSHIVAMAQIQGDPVLYLATMYSKATFLKSSMPEIFQEQILRSNLLPEAQRKARAIYWGNLALWSPLISGAPDVSGTGAGAFPRNIMMRRFFIAAYWMQWASNRDQKYWQRVGRAMSSPPNGSVGQIMAQAADVQHAKHFDPIGTSLGGIVPAVRQRMMTKLDAAYGGTRTFDVDKMIEWAIFEGASFLMTLVPAEDALLRRVTDSWKTAMRRG